jgi:malonyl-CoA/methylmalonyl-CoA synthetase
LTTKLHGENSLLVQRFRELAASEAGRLAVIDDVESSSFAELAERTARVARALSEQGLAGERIALLVTQGARWIEAFFGIVTAGAIAVPLSPLHPPAEQRFFVEASGARAIVVSDDLAPQVASYAESRLVLSVDELRRAGPGLERPCPSQDDDTAVILYTSGTTGKPKGALISHANLSSVAELVAQAWRWKTDDVLLHALPLHHLHGLGISLFVSLLSGGTTRMFARFDATKVWDELASATVLMGVPTMHKKLLDAFDAADAATRERWRSHAARLRLVTSGSAALPLSVGERWRELTGAYPLERFGMTEIGVGMTNPVDGERRPGSCGPALPGMSIRIVREDGSDAGIGETGEIWIRGPSVFKGYDRNPEATRAAFSDGWFLSGDTATFLESGYVKILGRTSIDILKSGGYKLSALEIEECLREHQAIGDVAVVGLSDETWGEIAVAAVIPRPGASLDEASLREWAKQRIASYKVPKRVVVLEDFPRNAVGKVVKPELVRRLSGTFRGS